MNFKSNWWKLLAVLIMLYVIIAGFLVPLRPGIKNAFPTTAATGESVLINVEGYNTMWENRQFRAWLKFTDDYILRAEGTRVEGFTKAIVDFKIPEYLPIEKEALPLTLVIDHPDSGPSVLPTALVVTAKNDSFSTLGWVDAEIENLNFKKTFAFPYRNVLLETIRNTYFHVPLWMSMYVLLLIATIYNIVYLRTKNDMYEERAYHLTLVSLLYGTLGIATGMIWAEHTWGKFWSWDIKQTMALLAMLMYVAYVFIRFSIPDETARRRFNAVYGIFAFVMIFPLLYIIPRMAASLHPGSGGNPAMGGEDMDNTMRMVFYPAIIGYTLMGLWLAQLSFRLYKIRYTGYLKN